MSTSDNPSPTSTIRVSGHLPLFFLLTAQNFVLTLLLNLTIHWFKFWPLGVKENSIFSFGKKAVFMLSLNLFYSHIKHPCSNDYDLVICICVCVGGVLSLLCWVHLRDWLIGRERVSQMIPKPSRPVLENFSSRSYRS